MVNLSFDIESREYNGRWFTSIRGWKADQVDESAAAAAPVAPAQEPMAPAAPYSAAPAADFGATASEDDLPF